jgi:hypothetical protein
MTTKTNFKLLLIVSIIAVVLVNCKKEKNDDNENKNSPKNISGYVQKGPFINGSSVVAYDLMDNFSATGKSFNTQITSNNGSFEFNSILLSSQYVSLRADGFFFNEVFGRKSASQITLFGIADLEGKNNININLMTHLEKLRVEYLLAHGKTFTEAKTQAQKEIMEIFNIEIDNMLSSENLNISSDGDANGVLLAISSILLGYRSESELTELLSDFGNDIREDGKINNESIGSKLISHAIYLDTSAIKENLTKMYHDLGVNANMPAFGKYISGFINKSKFQILPSMINYPATASYGKNVLFSNDSLFYSITPTELDWNKTYSFAADLHNGAALKIRIKSLSTSVSDTGNHVSHPLFYHVDGTEQNWNIALFDSNSWSQTFTAIESGKSCDMRIMFEKGTYLLEYYEMSSKNPSRKKLIYAN